MKNMKKLWAALLALAMTFSLAACGGTSDEDAATDDQPTGEEVSGDTAPESDVAYIQDKGTLVVGITYFAPMDYKEEGSDEWIGFDADMAKAFAESLGVEVEFHLGLQGGRAGLPGHRLRVEWYDSHRRRSGCYGYVQPILHQLPDSGLSCRPGR